MTDDEPRYDAAPPEEEREFAPSLRFRIFFTAAILIIAIGYMWVWRAKTERVQVEPVPVLALTDAVSYIESVSADTLARALLARLGTIRGLTVVDARTVRPADVEIAQLLAATLSGEGGRQSLVLRRTDAKTDGVLYEYRVEGASFDDTLYRMSVQIAMSFGLPRPTGPDPTRSSP